MNYKDFAFPCVYTADGLTKRELFAAMAMQGFCANQFSWDGHTATDRARSAVSCADELIAELAKEQS